MKILLINPPVRNMISLETPAFIKRNEGMFPPLGLMYIAAYLKEHVNYDVRILDAVAENISVADIEKAIRGFCPGIIGIMAHTQNLVDVVSVVNAARRVNHDVFICLGGPHARIYPYESLDIPGVDYVIPGEGEVTFAELVKAIGEKRDPAGIKGLVFRRGGRPVSTGDPEIIDDLDRLPFPDRESIDNARYYNVLGEKSVITTISTGRGCPYACSFCSTPKGRYRARSPLNVVGEIEECVKSGIEEIHIIDDTFNVDVDRVLGICDEIEKRGLSFRWSFRGRIDKVTDRMLERVKACGCHRIHLGVETCSDEGLKMLKKGITADQIVTAFGAARAAGISTVGYFMIGCPHERKKDDIKRTIDFALKLDPDFAFFNILVPYPGTELYADAMNRGLIPFDRWRDFAAAPKANFRPSLWGEFFGEKELTGLLNAAYRKFYFRPKVMFRMLNKPQGTGLLLKRIKAGLEMLMEG
ncbi:MAG: radical SAM protein [Candidatus Omnitrophota bacterium]